MPMETRHSDKLDRLGFGCARILGGAEAASTRRLIETALDCGIRHFDTAPSYGEGQSEALLGAILAGVKDVTITTKVGVPRPPPGRRSGLAKPLYRRYVRPLLTAMPGVKAGLVSAVALRPPPPMAERVPITAEMVRISLDASETCLRRRADYYLLHEPDRLALADDVLPQLQAWRDEGRIAGFGWGASVAPVPPLDFGTIVQQGFDPACPALHDPARTVIFHGALRTDLLPGSTAPQRLFAGLERYANAKFIVSASSPRQIRELAGALQ